MREGDIVVFCPRKAGNVVVGKIPEHFEGAVQWYSLARCSIEEIK